MDVAFIPTIADDVPVARDCGRICHHELTAIVTVNVDVAVESSAEGRGHRGEVGTDADAADVGVARVGAVRLKDDVVPAAVDGHHTAESDVARTSGALAEHCVDGQATPITTNEDDQFTARSGHDRPLARRGAERSRGEARTEEDRAGADSDGLARADEEIGRRGGVVAQGINCLRRPGSGVRLAEIDVLGDGEGLQGAGSGGGSADDKARRIRDADDGGSGRNAGAADARTDDESGGASNRNRRRGSHRRTARQGLGIIGRRRRRGGVGRGHEPAAGVLGREVGDIIPRGAEDGVGRAVGVSQQRTSGAGSRHHTVVGGQTSHHTLRVSDEERAARGTGDGAEGE